MAEYIEREAVLKIIADNCPHDKGGYNTEEEKGAGEACYYIRRAVETVPTADVTPKSEWISVDERLPDNYRAVLVACDGLTIGGYAQIAIGSYGGGFWSIADADGTMYLTKYMRCVVTHWMPLPEPPKMKGGAE